MKKLINTQNIIAILSIFFLVIFSFTGCINEPNNKVTSDIHLNEIALTKEQVPFNNSYDNYTSDPFMTQNLTGNNLTWIILENYLIHFQNNQSISLQISLLKFNLSDYAKKYFSLMKTYIVDVSTSTEINVETIGDESFYLKKSKTLKNDTNQWAFYFRINNIVSILSGSATDQSTLVDYAKLLEENIFNALKEND